MFSGSYVPEAGHFFSRPFFAILDRPFEDLMAKRFAGKDISGCKAVVTGGRPCIRFSLA